MPVASYEGVRHRHWRGRRICVPGPSRWNAPPARTNATIAPMSRCGRRTGRASADDRAESTVSLPSGDRSAGVRFTDLASWQRDLPAAAAIAIEEIGEHAITDIIACRSSFMA
jgi:hypothetical protein